MTDDAQMAEATVLPSRLAAVWQSDQIRFWFLDLCQFKRYAVHDEDGLPMLQMRRASYPRRILSGVAGKVLATYASAARGTKMKTMPLQEFQAVQAACENFRAQNEQLRAVLAAARNHVYASNEAEHMMDGFGPRRSRPSDGLLATIDEVLGTDQ